MGRPKNTPESFWQKVDIRGPEDCWPWKGGLRNGYGHFTMDCKDFYSHRFSYEQKKGPVPAGLDVMHRCNFKPCCNPGHLSPGTSSQNTIDAYVDGLAPSGEKHHKAKLTKEQVMKIRASSLTQVELSKIFKVRQNTISRIVRYEIWKHI